MQSIRRLAERGRLGGELPRNGRFLPTAGGWLVRDSTLAGQWFEQIEVD